MTSSSLQSLPRLVRKDPTFRASYKRILRLHKWFNWMQKLCAGNNFTWISELNGRTKNHCLECNTGISFVPSIRFQRSAAITHADRVGIKITSPSLISWIIPFWLVNTFLRWLRSAHVCPYLLSDCWFVLLFSGSPFLVWPQRMGSSGTIRRTEKGLCAQFSSNLLLSVYWSPIVRAYT